MRDAAFNALLKFGTTQGVDWGDHPP